MILPQTFDRSSDQNSLGRFGDGGADSTASVDDTDQYAAGSRPLHHRRRYPLPRSTPIPVPSFYATSPGRSASTAGRFAEAYARRAAKGGLLQQPVRCSERTSESTFLAVCLSDSLCYVVNDGVERTIYIVPPRVRYPELLFNFLD